MSAPLPADLYASKSGQVVAIITIFPILAAIIVSLRFYTRTHIVRLIAYDDWFILCGLIFSIATSICMGYQVRNGMGKHIQTLTIEQGVGSLKALFGSIIVYNLGLTCIKLSILLQYLRICVSKVIRHVCWFLVGAVITYGFWTVLSAIFNCIPVAYFWDERIPNGKCLNKPILWFVNAGINILTDFILIMIPFFLLKKLLLPKRQKITLMLILALGGFGCVTSILRLHALYIVTISQDITWDNPGTATWSSIELNIGIICASLPTLKALVKRYAPSLLSGSRSGNHYGESHDTRESNGAASRGKRQLNGSNDSDYSPTLVKDIEGGIPLPPPPPLPPADDGYDLRPVMRGPSVSMNQNRSFEVNARGANEGFGVSLSSSSSQQWQRNYTDSQIRVTTVTTQYVQPSQHVQQVIPSFRPSIDGYSSSETESRRNIVLF